MTPTTTDPVNDALDALKAAANVQTNKSKKNQLVDTTNTLSANLVLWKMRNLSSISAIKLCDTLRENMLPLYASLTQQALAFSSTLYSRVHGDRIRTAVENQDEDAKRVWESVQKAILSGIRDFIEENNQEATLTLVGTAFFPLLCRIYFKESDAFESTGAVLLSNVVGLLTDCAMNHSRNKSKLVDDLLDGKILGACICRSKDFRVLEELLELFATLIPSATKKGPNSRENYIQDVMFEASPQLSICKELTTLINNMRNSNWHVTAPAVLDILAKSDINCPQPFSWTDVKFCGSPFSTEENGRLYVDRRALTSYVPIAEDDQAFDCFSIAYPSMKQISVTANQDKSKAKITVILSAPPTLSDIPMSVTGSSDGGMVLQFDIPSSGPGGLDRFVQSLKRRSVGDRLVIQSNHGPNPATSKISLSQMVSFDTSMVNDLRPGIHQGFPELSKREKYMNISQGIFSSGSDPFVGDQRDGNVLPKELTAPKPLVDRKTPNQAILGDNTALEPPKIAPKPVASGPVSRSAPTIPKPVQMATAKKTTPIPMKPAQAVPSRSLSRSAPIMLSTSLIGSMTRPKFNPKSTPLLSDDNTSDLSELTDPEDDVNTFPLSPSLSQSQKRSDAKALLNIPSLLFSQSPSTISKIKPKRRIIVSDDESDSNEAIVSRAKKGAKGTDGGGEGRPGDVDQLDVLRDGDPSKELAAVINAAAGSPSIEVAIKTNTAIKEVTKLNPDIAKANPLKRKSNSGDRVKESTKRSRLSKDDSREKTPFFESKAKAPTTKYGRGKGGNTPAPPQTDVDMVDFDELPSAPPADKSNDGAKSAKAPLTKAAAPKAKAAKETAAKEKRGKGRRNAKEVEKEVGAKENTEANRESEGEEKATASIQPRRSSRISRTKDDQDKPRLRRGSIVSATAEEAKTSRTPLPAKGKAAMVGGEPQAKAKTTSTATVRREGDEGTTSSPNDAPKSASKSNQLPWFKDTTEELRLSADSNEPEETEDGWKAVPVVDREPQDDSGGFGDDVAAMVAEEEQVEMGQEADFLDADETLLPPKQVVEEVPVPSAPRKHSIVDFTEESPAKSSAQSALAPVFMPLRDILSSERKPAHRTLSSIATPEHFKFGAPAKTSTPAKPVLKTADTPARQQHNVAFALSHSQEEVLDKGKGIARVRAPSPIVVSPPRTLRKKLQTPSVRYASQKASRESVKETKKERGNGYEHALAKLLGEISETVIQRVCYDKIEGHKQEVYAMRNRILQQTASGFNEIRKNSVVHYNNMVELEKQYNLLGHQLCDAWEDIEKEEEEMTGRVAKIVEEHDRMSVTKRLAGSWFAKK